MDIRIDAKNLCFIAYYDPKSAPGKFEFALDAAMWSNASRLEQATIALRHTRVGGRDREDLIAYWLNTKRIRATDVELLNRSSKAVSAEEKAEEDEALTEILGGEYGYAKGTKKDISTTVVDTPPEVPSLAAGQSTEAPEEQLLKPARKGTGKRSRKVEK